MTKKFKVFELERLVINNTPLEVRLKTLEEKFEKLEEEFSKFKYIYRAMADDD